ncbi:RagB/SusD family nutrient uptake outer membrane protein [Robertkochia flava]|uniref:RagB/SusD family nutrient uptake outer membrane protein n=1 Tax=Robertkochia flava TaxID=3447986 RepID=UPI001CCF2512|nr:RagB/SusD family nutrient uptake outer membrane protein [Robertkochia marina]
MAVTAPEIRVYANQVVNDGPFAFPANVKETYKSTDDFRKILPIPRNELQTQSALEQNPGYATE